MTYQRQVKRRVAVKFDWYILEKKNCKYRNYYNSRTKQTIIQNNIPMGCTCDKFGFGASYKGGSELEKRPPPPALTETQAVVIRAQWELLKSHIANVGVITYIRLVFVLMIL